MTVTEKHVKQKGYVKEKHIKREGYVREKHVNQEGYVREKHVNQEGYVAGVIGVLEEKSIQVNETIPSWCRVSFKSFNKLLKKINKQRYFYLSLINDDKLLKKFEGSISECSKFDNDLTRINNEVNIVNEKYKKCQDINYYDTNDLYVREFFSSVEVMYDTLKRIKRDIMDIMRHIKKRKNGRENI